MVTTAPPRPAPDPQAAGGTGPRQPPPNRTHQPPQFTVDSPKPHTGDRQTDSGSKDRQAPERAVEPFGAAAGGSGMSPSRPSRDRERDRERRAPRRAGTDGRRVASARRADAAEAPPTDGRRRSVRSGKKKGMSWNGATYCDAMCHAAGWKVKPRTRSAQRAEWNGMERNGMEWNGTEWNGTESETSHTTAHRQ